MKEPETVETTYQVISGHRRLRLIWADRLAIAVAILLLVVLPIFYVVGGDNLADRLGAIAGITLFLTAIVLVIGRLADFIFTGRLRY